MKFINDPIDKAVADFREALRERLGVDYDCTKTLIDKLPNLLAKDFLKTHLDKLPKKQQIVFKKMYAKGDLSKSINTTVNQIPHSKLDWAMQQVHRTFPNANKDMKNLAKYLSTLIEQGSLYK